jgi:hypothetical protein
MDGSSSACRQHHVLQLRPFFARSRTILHILLSLDNLAKKLSLHFPRPKLAQSAVGALHGAADV